MEFKIPFQEKLKINKDLNEKEEERLKEALSAGFKSMSGLNMDVICGFPLNIDNLRPVQEYENYFKFKYPSQVDYIMENSLPEAVEEYDQVAKKFNSKLKELDYIKEVIEFKLRLEELEKLIEKVSNYEIKMNIVSNFPDIGDLHPAQTYEDYCQTRYPTETSQRTKEQSPKTIEEYNQVVIEFNNKLEKLDFLEKETGFNPKLEELRLLIEEASRLTKEPRK